MRKLNHFSWSFAISFWIFFFVFDKNIFFTFIFSFLVAFISWFPDVDIKLEKELNLINRYTFYLAYPFTLIPRILFKHRTFTHSIWLPLIMFYFAEYYLVDEFFKNILRIFYIAIFLHIFEDSFTVAGVRIFFPFSHKFRLASFRVDSKVDYFILEFFAYIILLSFFVFIFLKNSGLI